MHYIIMHYNDLLTNMDTYVYADAYMCAYTQGKCNMARIRRCVALKFISRTTNSNFVILIKYKCD